MRILKLSLILAIAILTASPALVTDVSSADCGTNVVVLGDSQNDVLEKCCGLLREEFSYQRQCSNWNEPQEDWNLNLH